jgi:hypothetical protein
MKPSFRIKSGMRRTAGRAGIWSLLCVALGIGFAMGALIRPSISRVSASTTHTLLQRNASFQARDHSHPSKNPCAGATRAHPLAPLTAFSATGLPAGPASGLPEYDDVPAGYTLKHTHGGPVYVYVISGQLTISDSAGTKTYCSGSFFHEPPGHVHTFHTVTRSEIFVLYVLPPGADATIPVK